MKIIIDEQAQSYLWRIANKEIEPEPNTAGFYIDREFGHWVTFSSNLEFETFQSEREALAFIRRKNDVLQSTISRLSKGLKI